MIQNPEEAVSLVEVVRFYADRIGNELAYMYLVDGEDQEAPLTFAELDRQSRAFAATLQQHTKPGRPRAFVVSIGAGIHRRIFRLFVCRRRGCADHRPAPETRHAQI
ncbi:hypothetical protein [Candidatus Villigracilis affinis]|uniref:hypothetical protein n=1 Tax=Candidatus Villigracilis affinis TaxID=3140682 RepID=UPI001DD91C7C|nr:hypothetical protein [Anaerolineales bacterium]